MSIEGHDCWEDCDEGPHGCVCGNDCPPSIRDYTPTTEEVRIKYRLSSGRQPGDFAEFDRWLAAHDAEVRAAALAEQGDKPDPCVMTHTPPFDFAQCETHDETFPLSGVCKWYGKESIAEVLQDEADVLRARAVRAEHELELLRAEQGETLTGEIRGLAFEDGEPHGIYCGLDECGCPDHDDPPRPAGTYITVRLDGDPPVGLWRVQVRRIPVPDTTEGES